ncbi:MAG: outer membrane lipid asymmetry maintenance protein MlaD [Gammaproteobacteria bacterium]|nr:outer membrane lipid asymmetry maintenance protein MlaD [Gammaproteobacteria bacterium]
MKQSRSMELLVGIFVSLGIAAMLMLAMQASNLKDFSGDDGYEIVARFQNSGGLKARAPIMVAGVRVGQVSGVALDHRTFESLVTLKIDSQYNNFPIDTSAAVFTAGLLGEQYVSLEPGGDENVLKNGDEIRLTQSSLILEQVIGQVLFSKAAGNE